jgi:hypothetical protein
VLVLVQVLVQVVVLVRVLLQVVVAQCQRARCARYQRVLRFPGGLRCCSEILLLPIVSPREASVMEATYRSYRCY